MKKTTRTKLVVNRETLRKLSNARLAGAVGAKLAPASQLNECPSDPTYCGGTGCCGGGGTSGAATSCVFSCLIC